MKAYRWHNGRCHFIVAAPNQREAAKLVGTSLADFRNFGGNPKDDEIAIVLARPGVVFSKPIDSPNTAYAPR